MTTLVSEDVVTRLARVTAGVDARAGDLDAGHTDVRDDLRALGAAGLFGLRDLPDTVRVLEQVSAVSLAAGFSAWAHQMAIHYLADRPDLSEALRTAHRPGVTAMAAGLKHVAGLGQLPIHAGETRRGLRLSGPIRWASNVFDDALVVLPARTAAGRLYVVAVDVGAVGVVVDPAPSLMALGATGSTSLRLQEVEVGAERIISADLTTFVRRIKPTFLLLQTAFCVGVSGAALDAAERVTDPLAAQFDGDRADLAAGAARNRRILYEFASAPDEVNVADVIRLRLDAANVAVAATRLESALAGGQGYRAGTAANRRFREAAFLPVQSPSEGQLRWELKQYE
ncbi:acyl-CoA dehydrogenase [Mycobacterium sp. CBMA293]|uniref:acyl-CoA/acyl-ACP dehydrogenase n=1 Tax=unclassified Mycolicibacterium TaxID=2636767 RepID=UPI0012DE5D2D|nr:MULTISPECIES: acyl-CoA/acyl-ACP dehydrogenase [unclassified Mycolicibacterium]MUL48627.1 acyl-CoA dehydrogenase [Mycolicibacterium sp. CBMA 360]MUL60875.1 acyl-CoA dehydrogenase [Mycolicibacterium sp. CBMA 335]MUL71888.1 acyl-CoA dehydrogenase [Mycolicibacterium sp. CBMA 311]MUL95816.1 acyl-CoA dehydrogenase [Mycolicibacterium sp. CBMA 230]MUM06414.1 acyl-CoA dehydrogenase [Mycolicibacterium sp. CBMA 213]